MCQVAIPNSPQKYPNWSKPLVDMSMAVYVHHVHMHGKYSTIQNYPLKNPGDFLINIIFDREYPVVFQEGSMQN